MSRLKVAPPRIPTLVARMAPPPVADRPAYGAHRRGREPWQAWYKTAEWQRLRWACLTRDRFTCRICVTMVADTSLLVADHVTPHRGHPALFWAQDNLQTLCKGCHDTTKAREERQARQMGQGF